LLSARTYSAAYIQMSKSTILVVDDDTAVSLLLRHMLADKQYQVQVCQSAADAFEAIEKRLYDVYIIDYKLADGTGIDVAERIRAKGSDAPIILLSGYYPSTVALSAAKLGIVDTIEKPFSRTTIINAVRKAVGIPKEALINKSRVSHSTIYASSQQAVLSALEPAIGSVGLSLKAIA
jgi:DNA-binding NtrC family response regulator